MQREYQYLIFSWFCLTVRGPQKRFENVYAFHYKWRIKLGLRLIKIWWELNVLMLLNIYGSVKQKKIIDKPKTNRQFAHNTISSGALICKILFAIIFLSQINFSWSSAHNPLRPDMVWCYSGDHVWLSTWLLCEL